MQTRSVFFIEFAPLRYGYCYGRSYREVKEKVAQCRAALAAGEAPPQPDPAERPGGHHQGVNTAPPCSHKDPQNRKNGEVQTKMNAKTTKRALFSSVLAIVLCLAMLIGTTFAWFTDTASTGVDKIKAGNLDVELEYSTDMENWQTATSSTKLFNDDILWEPGVTQIVYLRVKNEGSLALKYTMGLNSQVGFTNGKNVDGETYNIGDYLKMGTANMSGKTAFANREAAWTAVSGNADAIKNLKPFVKGMPTLNAGETTDPIALVIYMPTEVGNEANPAKSKTGSDGASYVYKLGIEVNATQATVENDSFDNTYDENAPTAFKTSDFGFSYGTNDVTGNIQANGGYGVVTAARSAIVNVNANVYAVYSSAGGNEYSATAVKAMNSGTINITGGTYMQVGVPDDDPCDLIYANGSGQINISGGTFKAAHPENTLNVLDSDRGKAKITVSGGSFFQYDPSHPTLGANEVIVADGYKVVQDGDGLFRLLAPSVAGLLACVVCLCATSWAWFSASVTAAATIRTASYTVSVTVRQGENEPVPVIASENGEFSIDLTTGETYTIKLTPTGNASFGYCLVKYNETTYYTDQLTTGSLSFTVTAADEATLTITPTWGEYTGSEFKPLAELSLPTNDPVETDQPENETDTVESADEPKDEEQEQTPEENSDTKSPETPTEPAPDPATDNTPAEGDSAQEPTPTTPDAPAPDAPNTPTPDAPAAPDVPSAPAAAPESEN